MQITAWGVSAGEGGRGQARQHNTGSVIPRSPASMAGCMIEPPAVRVAAFGFLKTNLSKKEPSVKSCVQNDEPAECVGGVGGW